MYQLRIEGHIRVSTFSGPVTKEDVAQAMVQLRELDAPHATDALVDLTAAEKIAFDSFTVHTIADWSNSRASGVRPRRVAFAVADPVAYGYARAFQMLGGEGMELRIFRSVDAARAWLEGGGDDVEP
ncbi:MAG TPA: STAS/SEC14 domain-containing protein [Longimicrobiales bacterium]